jgi:hypothetical protein
VVAQVLRASAPGTNAGNTQARGVPARKNVRVRDTSRNKKIICWGICRCRLRTKFLAAEGSLLVAREKFVAIMQRA